MIRTILIDDEPLARSIIREYLQSHPEFEIIEECANGFEGAKAIMQHKPDLVFLDVQMPKLSGFEMLELLEEVPPVIFTTAFDQYAFKAFEANAVDYLLKPIHQDRFDKALAKWLANSKSGEIPLKELAETGTNPDEKLSRITVRNGSAIKIIPLQDIHYFEAYDDYVKIFTAEGMFLKKKTMSYYEQHLPENQFVRIHRSYILAIKELTKIEPMEKESYLAILKNNSRIPISKAGYTKLNAALEK